MKPSIIHLDELTLQPRSTRACSLQGRVTGFNSWHGSTLENPKGWDKNGNDRRFKVDMAGIAFNAVLTPRFTGPRYGYHETDIVEQTGVVELVRDGTRDTGTDGDLVRTGPTCPRLARDVLPSILGVLVFTTDRMCCARFTSAR